MQKTDRQSEIETALFYQTHIAVHRIGYKYNLCDLSQYEPAPLYEALKQAQKIKKSNNGDYIGTWQGKRKIALYEREFAIEENKRILGYAYKTPLHPTQTRDEAGNPYEIRSRATSYFSLPIEKQLNYLEKYLEDSIYFSSGIFPHAGEYAEPEEIEIATVKKNIKDLFVAQETEQLIQCSKINAEELCRSAVKINLQLVKQKLSIF